MNEKNKNGYKIKDVGDHLEITISCGTVVKIDHDCLWILREFPSWQDRKGYIGCERWIDTPYGRVLQRVYLHRLVTNPTSRWQVDHVNRQKADCRKSNLRMATASQNGANKIATRSKSGMRGVTIIEKRKLSKKYLAHIRGKNLGYYFTIEEAGRAYDRAAKERYGPFAILNFPDAT